jgi:hypothetical protein
MLRGGWKSSALALLAAAPLVAGVAVGVIEVVCKALAGKISTQARTQQREQTLRRLCASIPGNDKSALATIFGPPQASAGFSAISPALPVSADYVHAEIWFYPLDPEARAALAVRFEADVASEARLFQLR